MMSKQELIEFFMDRDILIDPELLSALDESATPETVYSMLRQRHPQTTSKEKEHEDRELTDADAPTETHQPSSLRYAVKIITSYEEQSQKREVQHFIEHFNKRYAVLERMLQQRQGVLDAQSVQIGGRWHAHGVRFLAIIIYAE